MHVCGRRVIARSAATFPGRAAARSAAVQTRGPGAAWTPGLQRTPLTRRSAAPGERCYNRRMAFATRLTPEMIARHTGSGWWGGDTIYGLLSARVAAHPEREAIVDA